MAIVFTVRFTAFGGYSFKEAPMGKYLGIKYNLSPEVHAILDRAGARLATIQEQADWVEGHLNGHEGNQSYRFEVQPTMDDAVYVITKDIDLPPLYGEEALTLIVRFRLPARRDDIADFKRAAQARG